jgi:hypothetical protein
VATVYQRLLQDRFGLLPPALGRFLGEECGGRAAGRLTVRRAAGCLRRLAARVLGIPPAGDYALRLEVTPCAGGQRWLRRFGGHAVETVQADHRGLLVESSGPASIGFELAVEGGTLYFHPRRAWLFGLPLPLALAPGIEAENRAGGAGGWHVRVRFRVPLLGWVGEYEGEVLPARD